MFKEFREFALKGNVVDLAIGVIIGAAFGKIIDSLVKDVIMPVIGSVTGGIDFSNLYVPLSSRAGDAARAGASYDKVKQAGAVLGYGEFLTVTVNFLIIAFVLYLAVRAMNSLHVRSREKAAQVATREEVLLAEIRDLLARQSSLPH